MFRILPDILDTSRPIFWKLLILTSNCLHKSLTTSCGSLELQKPKKESDTVNFGHKELVLGYLYSSAIQANDFTSVVSAAAKYNSSELLRCLQMVVTNFKSTVLMTGLITEPDIWFQRPKCTLKNKLIFLAQIRAIANRVKLISYTNNMKCYKTFSKAIHY